MAIPGIQPIGPMQSQTPIQPVPEPEARDQVHAAIQAMKEESLVVDKEVMHVTTKQAGHVEQDTQQLSAAQIRGEENMSNSATAEMASVINSELLENKKKAKKKSRFDNEMEKMSELAEVISAEGLDEEQKQEVELFKENMRKINALKKRLAQLEEEEDFYGAQLAQAESEQAKSDIDLKPAG